MFLIQSCPLPDEALLGRYSRDGSYTDCYMADIPISVSHSQYVTAFYTTTLFKLERFILKWTVFKLSTDAQAKQLADGLIESFAAWTVEARTENQLLMCDFASRTRSWLMVLPLEKGTRLYFGSAVVPKKGKSTLELGVRLLIGFHQLYSVVLLYAARWQLEELYLKQPR